MLRIISCLLIALVLCPFSARALSDARYNTLLAQSPTFRAEEAKMSKIWQEVMQCLPEREKKRVQEEQQNWLNNELDEESGFYTTLSITEGEAYAYATHRRANVLRAIRDNCRLTPQERQGGAGHISENLYNDIEDAKYGIWPFRDMSGETVLEQLQQLENRAQGLETARPATYVLPRPETDATGAISALMAANRENRQAGNISNSQPSLEEKMQTVLHIAQTTPAEIESSAGRILNILNPDAQEAKSFEDRLMPILENAEKQELPKGRLEQLAFMSRVWQECGFSYDATFSYTFENIDLLQYLHFLKDGTLKIFLPFTVILDNPALMQEALAGGYMSRESALAFIEAMIKFNRQIDSGQFDIGQLDSEDF